MTAWRGIRYRPDVGWELRCESCSDQRQASYWPLTDEFWIPRRMSRCRMCWNERRNLQRNRNRTVVEIEARTQRRRARHLALWRESIARMEQAA